MEGYVLKKEQQYIVIEPTGKIAKSTKTKNCIFHCTGGNRHTIESNSKNKRIYCTNL